MGQIYPTIDFSKIDWRKIPPGGTFVAFNSADNGILTKIDYLGNISPLIGGDSTGQNYDFYYSETSPLGSGTSTIGVGSIWYNTTNAQSYVYVFDGENYFWLSLSQPGPIGATGGTSPLKKTTQEILSISAPAKGLVL